MIEHNIPRPGTPGKDANHDAKAGVLGAHPVGAVTGAAVAGDVAGNSATEVVGPTVGVKH